MPRKRKVELVDLTDDAGPSTSTKGRKKATKEKPPPPEPRLRANGTRAMFRHAPTQQIQARIDRALCVGAGFAHRMYLVDMQQVAPVGAPGGASSKFFVMGTTGNVYEVTIGRHSRCTCPDNLRNPICKHMLFVMLRVLRRTRNDPLIWQDALLSDEVDELLSGIGANQQDQSIMASTTARDRYLQLTGKAPVEAVKQSEEPAEPEARPVDGEDCPICYEPMSSSGEPNTCCSSCRNSMHEKCFTMWANQKRSSHQPVTCVYCRATWTKPGAGAAKGGDGGGAYLNLAASNQHVPTSTELYGGSPGYQYRRHMYGRDGEEDDDGYL